MIICMKRYIIIIAIIVAATGIQATFTDQPPANKAELGKLLFFDPILSKDSSISCATCHKPAFAFADTSAVSIGVAGAKGTRNTPSSMNVLLHRSFFWDGRAASLEKQALAPIENPAEMALPLDSALLRLKNSKTYNACFKTIFNAEPTHDNLSVAIASFERTLETSDSPYDEWKFYNKTNAVSDAVKRGFIVFNEKGKCIKCHLGSDFTANEFRNIGLFNGNTLNDSGRASITKNKDDLGKFKTAALRNLAVTAPYMHNGMFKTLKEVINFYNDPAKIVPGAINRDTILAKPLGLTEPEKSDLEAFLISLTDKRFTAEQRTISSRLF